MSNHQNQDHVQGMPGQSTAKKKRLIEKICPSKILEIIPESHAYYEMYAFERKLDLNINRLTLDIQEALKKPSKVKKTLRIFISNLFYTHQDTGAPSWELRIEGRLTEDTRSQKRKFSSFFKSLVIELDSTIYGPDDHLIEWIRTPHVVETDGFQLRRPGDLPVKCTILLQLEYQPRQFKLEKRLAKLLGRKLDTRPRVILALWQYIKSKSLQDPNEREYINNDRQMKQIFECKRMKLSDIPHKLNCLLLPPDPIIIHHSIVRGIGETQRTIYELDVELEDVSNTNNTNIYNSNNSISNPPLPSTTSSGMPAVSSASNISNSNNMTNRCMDLFTMSNASTQELQQLDEKMCDTLEAIKLTRNTFDLFSSFANDPYQFTNRWLASQTSNDLNGFASSSTGTNDQTVQQSNVVNGDTEEEQRRAEYYYQPWLQEAVCRYFYRKVQKRRGDLDLNDIQTP